MAQITVLVHDKVVIAYVLLHHYVLQNFSIFKYLRQSPMVTEILLLRWTQ